ncbi:YceI family protein [Fulvivirga sp. 29W222]|uniref:YceI family protein n=1 Tax=Fulvivirga marina TaxID=2494733 RepID=A0A937FVJ9_9BACT|nr:YceI family protein [Fulvivirga marina]MBL6445783.1 YceI family protein [Fulvivirga marina]
MKNIYIILIISFISSISLAQSTWVIDPTHSSVQFDVSHLAVSSVTGFFTSYAGTLTSKKSDFEGAKVNATIEVASITTNNMERDKHLKEDDFFNAEKYPEIKFESTSFKKVSDNNFLIEGNLTIRNVTKPVTLEAEFGGIVSINNKKKAGFTATGTIDRFEFGLKWDDVLDNGGLIVGEKVDIILKMELVKQ